MNDIQDLDRRHIWHPFTQEATAPVPPEVVRGDGAHLITSDGNRILDLVSSWWVNLHGHSNPAIARAVAEQAATLEHTIFAEFTHAPAAKLAARIASLLPGTLNRVFYSDDGSTSVEVALKIAIQYFVNRGETKKKRIVAFKGGYHGDTLGAMSVGRGSSYFRAWEHMLFPVDIIPYPAMWNDDANIEKKEAVALEALSKLNAGKTAAIIIEPLIQGAGGMRMCRPEFLQALAKRAREMGALLIFDEVMTGFGRTGDVFACVKSGVEPDLVCLSKGLTGGFMAMGATVIRDSIREAFMAQTLDKAFLHGHSYTANPIACAAGLASLDLLLAPECQKRIDTITAIHKERLDALAQKKIGLRHRQCGTIAAMDLGDGAYGDPVGGKLKSFFRERGMLLRPLGPIAYFMPPYCIDDTDLHRAWDALEEVAKTL